jgi:quercetin dioxygenase-like cupin family protein
LNPIDASADLSFAEKLPTVFIRSGLVQDLFETTSAPWSRVKKSTFAPRASLRPLKSTWRLLQMKLCAVRVSLLAVLLFSPIVAPAVDQNSAVKVTSLLKTTSGWDGKQIVYPEGQAEMTALLVEIAPGESTGWHQHPVPSFGFLLEGTLEIALMDGRIKRMEQGEALSEVTDTMHIGRAVSKTPVKIVVFYAGAIGKSLTVNHPSSANLPR